MTSLRTAGPRLASAAVSAALVVLAFPDWDLFVLAWFSLVPLLLVTEGLTPRRVFLLGWLMGFLTNVGGFYWVSHTLTEFGQLPVWVGVLGVILLSAYTGLQYGLWIWVTRRLMAASNLGAAVVGPAVFVVIDWLFPMLFPWYIGNSQYNFLPVAQLAELGGIIAVSALVVGVNGALYDTVARRRAGQPHAWRPAAVGVGLLLAVSLGGWVRMAHLDAQLAEAPRLKVGLVQVNVSHFDKVDPRKRQGILERFLDMSREVVEAHDVEVVLWPETAVSFFVDLAKLEAPGWTRDLPRPLITGGMSFDRRSLGPGNRPRHYNSAFLFLPGGATAGVYHKIYRMLFSEYIPYGEHFPTLYKWAPHAGSFSRGPGPAVFELGDWRLGLMICYEDIIPRFGLEVAELDPHLLINLTNDSWFGDTAEPHQHMALAVFRSIELRRSLVRSTNTGISCYVDPVGRIKETSALFTTQTLVHEMVRCDSTTLYSVLGDWVPALGGLFCLALLGRAWRARRRGAR